MKITSKSASAVALILSLGACGSSSTPTIDTPTIENPVSRSGLPFATDDIPALIDGLTPGQALTVIFRTVIIDQPDLTETFLSELEVSFLPAPMTALADGTGTLTIDGETVELVNGVADFGEGLSMTLSQELIGVASALLSLELNDSALAATYRNDNGTFSKSYTVLGFETSDEDMAALAVTTGSASYTGEFTGFGEFQTPDANVEDPAFNLETVNISGQTYFEVSFSSGAVDGTLDITEVSATFDGYSFMNNLGGEVVSLGLNDGTSLDGNGFAGDANYVDDCPVCAAGTSNSSMDGVFYGVDAAELSGTVSIDFTAENGDNLTGVGGYVAGAVPPAQ